MTETLADLDQEICPWQHDLPRTAPLQDCVEIKNRFRIALLGTESVVE